MVTITKIEPTIARLRIRSVTALSAAICQYYRPAFAARPLRCAQDCPNNPEQSVTVEMPEPLGDREIIDGLATGLDLSDFLE